MSTEDNACTVNLSEVVAFSPIARLNKELINAVNLGVHFNCYEPGQVMLMHKDPQEVDAGNKNRQSCVFAKRPVSKHLCWTRLVLDTVLCR